MNEFFFSLKGLVLSKTIKDSTVVFLGNTVSSLLGIIFTILAARFLGPEGWGIVAAVGSLIPILVAFSDFGIGASMFQYTTGKWGTQEEPKAKAAYQASFALRLASATLLSLLLVAFSSWLSQVLFNTTNPTIIVLTSLGLFGFTLLDFQIFSIEAKQKWTAAAIFIASTNAFRVGFILILAWLNLLGLLSVLLVFSGSAFLVFAISLFFVSGKPIFKKGWTDFVKSFASFSAWMGGNKIISVLGSRVDILIIIQLLGAYEAGIYGAANRLAMGVPLILGSFATVLAARFASVTDKKELLGFFQKSIGLSGLIAAGLVLGIIITPLITSFFGPEYTRSKEILQLLFVSMIPFALSVPAVNILIYYFKKPGIITCLSIVQLVIIIFINYLYLPTLGVLASVLAMGFANLLTMIVTYFFAFRYLATHE